VTKKLSIFVTALFLVTMIFAGTAMAETSSPASLTWTDETVLVSNASKPTVCYDGEKYHMWYLQEVGEVEKMYYQTSSDLSTWTSQGACNYSLTTYADNAFIIKTGESSFYLWCTDNAGTKIVRLSSTDGIAWKDATDVLSKGTGTEWDADKIDHPMVIKDGASYKLYYQGRASSTGDYSIGVATANSLLGPFTRVESNPVLTKSESESDAWDSKRVFQPWVVKTGSEYYMFYAGNSTSYTANPDGIGMATSADGISWTKQGRILGTGSSRVAHPAVTHKEGTWYIWYLNGNDIYHATAPSDTGTTNVTFNVTAVGDPTYPDIIGVSVPATLAIGTIGTGQEKTETLTIKNIGNVAVNVGCTVTPTTVPTGSSVTVTESIANIAVGGTANATVTVTAGTATGEGSATITVTATAVK
jgi:predicted GH43/DUF377 family glycosyl hydrolase